MNPATLLPLLAAVSEPAPAGRTSALGVAIILLCLAAGVAFAVRSAIGHFRGEGGCCGGVGDGFNPNADPGAAGAKKTLDGPVVAEKTLSVSGMSCGHCKARVEAALDAVPGAVAEVDLAAGRARVRLDRDVPDSALRAAVEEAGFAVTAIS